ncbi:cytochrome C [Geomonas oryzisoli]|uniref:Cytochrome C n=1 Tax=Geomonas oryzisoli TaxID=2847992 RepID=A0ABX8J245_9BACT|nr:cytochrome c3 family protein [Geomonas oryzisoli]QWV92410.1 cytochrome C [Geomonas oryzisoli]
MFQGSVRRLLVAILLFLGGCDPVARHQFLVTFFDDVPVLPPLEQYCSDAEERQVQAAKARAAGREVQQAAAPTNSSHPPYAEKRCNDCHQAEKTSVSGLIKPKSELCFMCHPKILKHAFAHGPAAEGECLGCHLPHEANYPSLLVREPSKLCEKCHSEKRLAAAMHDKIKSASVVCIDCHDPHSGTSRYFLK